MTTAYAPVAESSDNLTIGQHVHVPTLLLAYVSRNRDANLSKKGDTHTHTHTHPFNGPFPRLPG